MFRCEWCENYFDKSECEYNPRDDYGNICSECLSDYKEEQRKKEKDDA